MTVRASPATSPFASISGLVGHTPLVELRSLAPSPGIRLFAKLEGQNPTGSVKDRVVYRILSEAARSGALAPGQPIVEASTGNTGVSLALFGRLAGHRVIVCVPESVYPEIELLLLAYGAEVRRVPRQAGIKSAIEVARRVAFDEGAYFLDQFGSPENVRAHYETTGAEIAADLERVDVFVAGLGTGGTISGAGRRLKEARPSSTSPSSMARSSLATAMLSPMPAGPCSPKASSEGSAAAPSSMPAFAPPPA
jgi:cysteine synthase